MRKAGLFTRFDNNSWSGAICLEGGKETTRFDQLTVDSSCHLSELRDPLNPNLRGLIIGLNDTTQLSRFPGESSVRLIDHAAKVPYSTSSRFG